MDQPIRIDPDAYYTAQHVQDMFGVSIRAIGDACRSEALKSKVRAGKRIIRGAWLIEWLEGVESKRETVPA